ncbi:unnamed protein product, partial [Ceratitis capitata]
VRIPQDCILQSESGYWMVFVEKRTTSETCSQLSTIESVIFLPDLDFLASSINGGSNVICLLREPLKDSSPEVFPSSDSTKCPKGNSLK